MITERSPAMRRTYAEVCRRLQAPAPFDERLEKVFLDLARINRIKKDNIDDGQFIGVTIETILTSPPEVMWAQLVDRIYLTVLLPLDAQEAKVVLQPGGAFTFTSTGKTPPGSSLMKMEGFKLDLFDDINVEESTIHKTKTGGRRSILCVIEKAEKKWWKRLLRHHVKPPHYLKVDWDKWVDEEDYTGAPDFDTGGMDFSRFGGMGGIIGMPGMEGLMGGMGDLDDEEQEEEKPAAGHEGEKREAAAAAAAAAPVEKKEVAPST